jgi:hypothetical protein
LDKTARLWDTGTSKPIRSFKGHTDWIRSVTFSPDGARVLTGSFDLMIGAPANAAEAGFTSGRILTRHQAYPGRKLSARPEMPAIINRSDDRCRDYRADARQFSLGGKNGMLVSINMDTGETTFGAAIRLLILLAFQVCSPYGDLSSRTSRCFPPSAVNFSCRSIPAFAPCRMFRGLGPTNNTSDGFPKTLAASLGSL